MGKVVAQNKLNRKYLDKLGENPQRLQENQNEQQTIYSPKLINIISQNQKKECAS